MSKKEIYELVSDYVDGNMSGDELKEFELKIGNDSALQKEIEDIKNLIQDIKKTQNVSLPHDFDSRLKDATDRVKPSYKFGILKLLNNPVWTTAGSVAAAILLVVTVTVFFSETQNSPIIDSNDIAFEDDATIDNEDIEIHQAKSEKLENLK